MWARGGGGGGGGVGTRRPAPSSGPPRPNAPPPLLRGLQLSRRDAGAVLWEGAEPVRPPEPLVGEGHDVGCVMGQPPLHEPVSAGAYRTGTVHLSIRGAEPEAQYRVLELGLAGAFGVIGARMRGGHVRRHGHVESP